MLRLHADIWSGVLQTCDHKAQRTGSALSIGFILMMIHCIAQCACFREARDVRRIPVPTMPDEEPSLPIPAIVRVSMMNQGEAFKG